MGQASQEQLNNPLHGVKLKDILEYLEAHLGWEEMALATNLNCFKNRPTLKSSLRFIRKTEWARIKVQNLYLECIEPEFHPSVLELWDEFIIKEPSYVDKEFEDAFHLGNSDKETKGILKLISDGIKSANIVNFRLFELEEEKLPEIGNLYILCNWYGHAQMIIETTKIEEISLDKLDNTHANLLGLAEDNQWESNLRNSLEAELEEMNEEVTKDQALILEHFKVIHKA